MSEIHTCHADCPCHQGRKPRPDFIDAEVHGLANVIVSAKNDPLGLRLAVAGAFLEDDPAAALDEIADAYREADDAVKEIVPALVDASSEVLASIERADSAPQDSLGLASVEEWGNAG